jgi:4-hydroxybenzoyl-CoA thioesterase
LTVEWGQCDPAGIVFNPRFFEMFDVSTWQLIEALLGVKRHEFPAAFNVVGAPLVDARANFLKPARFGDAIEIASRVSEARHTSFDVEHRISVGGELSVEGAETRVWAVRDSNNPDKIRAVAIPADVIARFQAS